MLDRMLICGTATRAALFGLGRLLAQFYAQQRRIDFTPADYLERLAAQIHTDQSGLLKPELQLPPELVDAVTGAALTALAALRDGLVERAQQQRIVEAHGDLRPEHVCLSDPPCIIDALETSEDLRAMDPAEELAEHTGHPRDVQDEAAAGGRAVSANERVG